MTTTSDDATAVAPTTGSSVPTATTTTGPPAAGRRSHLLTDWRPEDATFWRLEGRRIAFRNLVMSVLSEHIGFSIWSLWSVMVLFMPEPVWGFSVADKFLLTTVPTLVGAALRIPYTFAVGVFGGRTWTVFASLLLLVPTVLMAIVLQPGVSLGTLLVVAAFAGVGGGNFASSMANINAFYPDREKGWALGLNAGGGNLGVAVAQLVGLLVLAVWGAAHPRYVVAIYIPLVLLSALGAWLTMDNIEGIRNEKRGLRDVTRFADTWLVSLLYIGTFGSFIGFGFAFGQVLQVQFKADFPTPLSAAYITFLGPLIGSVIRPVGGKLADRFGGPVVTFVNFAAMAVSAALVLAASLSKSLPLFLVGFIALFVFSGIGNGSTYKMIPTLFLAKAGERISAGADRATEVKNARRLSTALIGLAGSIGAFGGVLVNLAFRQSFLTVKTGDGAYIAFLVFYGICLVVTFLFYVRPAKARTAAAAAAVTPAAAPAAAAA